MTDVDIAGVAGREDEVAFEGRGGQSRDNITERHTVVAHGHQSARHVEV